MSSCLMASIYRDTYRNGYRVQIYVRGVRRKLWVGDISKGAAQAVAGHLDRLNIARDTGTIPPPETRRWVANITPRIRNRLADWGLIEAAAAAPRLPGTLGGWTRHYIDARTDWADRTRQRMENVRRHLIAEIGTDTALVAITPGAAEDFARWARRTHKPSHAGKTIADARQFFTAAIKHRLLAENPFAGINSSQSVDELRKRYVSAEVCQTLLDSADAYTAAMLALARFAGLRVPSELLTMEWSKVSWSESRFAVYSPKTKQTRIVPLFPEILPHLRTLFDEAPEGARWCFHRHRSAAARRYRVWLLKLIEACGVEPWPDLWRNLRFSAKNDLLGRFPEHVVCAWLGHDRETGRKHYDRPTEADFGRAVGSLVGSSGRQSSPSVASEDTKKPGNCGDSRVSEKK